VRAYDPTVTAPPLELAGSAEVCSTAQEALRGADVAVVATEWPLFHALTADALLKEMRRPRVVDPNHFLAAALANHPAITYRATGRPARTLTEDQGRRVA
jgi:UDPglucose 6-dehydrogenase